MHETHRLQLLGGLLYAAAEAVPGLAVGETVILPHPPLPLARLSMRTGRERQQTGSLADG